jgi:hypothetical protein
VVPDCEQAGLGLSRQHLYAEMGGTTVKRLVWVSSLFVFLLLLAVPVAQAAANSPAFSVESQNESLREIKNGGTYPYGRGIIAFGTASYNTYVNLDATLIGKRSAYMRAYARAQEELLDYFHTAMLKCEKRVENEVEDVETGTGGAENASIHSRRECYKRNAGTVEGFVLYSVKDHVTDPIPKKSVTVKIVSDPHTRAAVQRVSETIVRTGNVNYAWNEILRELRGGILPPLGARLIEDRKTKEDYVVGFGSAIILKNRDPTMERHLIQAAAFQARIRSQVALLAFLRGDRVVWSGRFSAKTTEGSSQFAPSAVATFQSSADKMANIGRKIAGVVAHMGKGDYSGAITDVSNTIGDHSQPDGIPTYRESRHSFLYTLKQTRAYKGVIEGRVPAGLTSRTFEDKAGNWAIAVSIYSQPAAIRARNAYKQRQSATMSLSAGSIRRSGGLSESAANPPGPSGQVTPLGAQ